MSHNSEQYDTNLENFRDNTSEVERLEKYAEACDKKARTYFESMKRVSHENNLLREENESLKREVAELKQRLYDLTYSTYNPPDL